MKSNITSVIARMQALPRAIEEEAFQAAVEWSEETMTLAKEQTPVDTGALRASGHVQADAASGAIRLGFGGPAAPYAEHVHENLDAFHRVGKAKFLEDPVRQRQEQLQIDISIAIERGKQKVGLR